MQLHSAQILLLCLPVVYTGHPGADGRLGEKSCEATGALPGCAEWCNENFVQTHCPDCACSGCDFCAVQGNCEPLPNSDDTNVQQCEPFCSESSKKQHCLRCSCQKCSYCPHADKLADRDVDCKHGQCSDFCDPLYKQQHCQNCDCEMPHALFTLPLTRSSFYVYSACTPPIHVR